MSESEQQRLSPLVQQPTYGERVYDYIFNKFLNFWVNLTVSAAFTYWVTHQHQPLKIFGKSLPAPSKIQQNVAAWFYNFAPMRVFSKGSDIGGYDPGKPPTSMRGKAANNAANILTLTAAGHPIMIGSVWLGAKIKSPLVEWLNRRHYGDAAMEDPLLKARHAAIEVEERPTLLGAVLGRAGTIVATQTTGYTIGNSANLFTWLGKSKLPIPGKSKLVNFTGIDHIAGVFGDSLGAPVQELLKNQTDALDRRLEQRGYGWSAAQTQRDDSLRTQPYQNAAQHFGKYLAQDVLYTIVTASTISPAINWLKGFIPGLTYIPKAKAHLVAEIPYTPKELHIKPNRIADAAPEAEANASEIPDTTISGSKLHAAQIANENRRETLGVSA